MKILSHTIRNAKLRAISIARRNSESTRRKSWDEEERLTTTIAIWPAYMESRSVHEHDVYFLTSVRTDRQMVMGYYDNKRRKKGNGKAGRERAQVLRKEKEVMRKIEREVWRKEKKLQ